MRHLPFSLLFLVSPAAAQFVEPTCLLQTFPGDTRGGSFGWVSDRIADLDGDGAAEVAITAPFRAGTGRCTVYSGRTGQERFHVDGAASGDRFGFAVRDAGDVDGDMSTDLVVGAPATTASTGSASLVSGKTGAVLMTFGFGLAGDSFGYSVAAAGDVDGDGRADVAVGALGEDTAGNGAGAVYIVSGKTGTMLQKILGQAAGDAFGSALGTVGDVTGDGLPEIVVGARTGGTARRGEAYVYDLTAPAQPLHTLVPDSTAVSFGQFFASGAGDVNNDGSPDVYIGDFSDSQRGLSAGKAYIFDGLTGMRIWTIAGPGPQSGFGIGRGAGDIDGDGHADLILCGWTDSSGASRAGKAWLYSGADASVIDTFSSTISGTTLGFDAHGMGDVDGDGELDFLVTGAEWTASTGIAYLVSGCDGVTMYGAGVAGSGNAIPLLSLANCPGIGLSPTLEIQNGLGGAAGVVLISSARNNMPLGAGQLLVGSGVDLVHMLGGAVGTAGAGVASLGISVPNMPSLRGAGVHAQAGYADSGAPFGLSLTAGLTLTVQ